MANLGSETVVWRDKKKLFWPFAAVLGFIPAISFWSYQNAPASITLWASTIFYYGLIPLLEVALGKDETNPPSEAIASLRRDPFYKWSTFAALPICYVSWISGAWFLSVTELEPLAYIAVILASGMMAAILLTTAHEVGHRSNAVSKNVARLMLCLCGMGHFRVEHNFGHHVMVATKEDNASAMMGESFYRFICRELPGGFGRAWALEAKRLARRGAGSLSLNNEVLANSLITLSMYMLLVFAFGLVVLPYLLGVAIVANLMLSSANYIEHYGLLRAKNSDGKYERVQPKHSWNANHVLSNLMLFHLQRHSDHHAHAERPYQCLRHFDEAPQLPAGYFTMYLAAWIPPVWFAVMDKRVADQMEGDLTKANLLPSRAVKLMKRYHRPMQA